MTDASQNPEWNEEWMPPPGLDQETALRLLQDPNAMRDHVVRRSRLPFQEVLARMLAAEPSFDEVKRLARENPDKWAKMVRDLASLSGYKDGIEIDANIGIQVHSMSDAELLTMHEQLARQLRQMDTPNVEDGEFYEVEEPEVDELPEFLR